MYNLTTDLGSGNNVNILDSQSWQNLRDHISDSMSVPQNDLKKARRTIERASQSFRMEKGKEAADMVLENERLRTTLMVLN